jgi:hypothetical protein
MCDSVEKKKHFFSLQAFAFAYAFAVFPLRLSAFRSHETPKTGEN